MCAVPTYALAVCIFDRILNMALSDDGVRKRKMVGETATPEGEGIEKHCEGKGKKISFVKCECAIDYKPVINEKVVFLSAQCLPDVGLLLVLFVQCDVLRQSLGQHAVQALCLLPLVVNDHVDHVLQSLTLQLLVQAVHSAHMREIRV